MLVACLFRHKQNVRQENWPEDTIWAQNQNKQ
jgi:hypothetical protein